MSSNIEMFWDMFQTTGSLEAYLLYRSTVDIPLEQ
jgi:hypothetical protein